MADVFSKDKRSEVMSKIRSKWTSQEVTVHNYLKGNRIRHKMHPKMYGNPDILLKDKKVVIFLDGDFWHGYKWKKLKIKLRDEFWKNKIKGNIKRDKKITKKLESEGWTVVRLWGHEICKNIDSCINRIKNQQNNTDL